MMNIQGLMKQAQMVQKKMEEAQAKLAEQELTGTSGGGMVKITLNGKFEMKKVEIDKSMLEEEDVSILEDMIAAAYNDAHAKVDASMAEGMKDVTGGLNLGGLKIPFLGNCRGRQGNWKT